MKQYIAGRRVTALTIVVGWLFAGFGGIVTATALLYELVALVTHILPAAPLAAGFPVAIGACVAGLFLVLCSWIARAVFDVAEKLQAKS